MNNMQVNSYDIYMKSSDAASNNTMFDPNYYNYEISAP